MFSKIFSFFKRKRAEESHSVLSPGDLEIVSSEEAEWIRQEISELRAVIAKNWPYFYPIVTAFDLIFVRTKNKKITAGVLPGTRSLIINVDFWKKLTPEEKLFVLLHETIHVALNHVASCRMKQHVQVYNLAADAVINEMLRAAGVPLPSSLKPVTGETVEQLTRGQVPAREVVRKSADELYYILLRYVKSKNLRLSMLDVAVSAKMNIELIEERARAMANTASETRQSSNNTGAQQIQNTHVREAPQQVHARVTGGVQSAEQRAAVLNTGEGSGKSTVDATTAQHGHGAGLPGRGRSGGQTGVFVIVEVIRGLDYPHVALKHILAGGKSPGTAPGEVKVVLKRLCESKVSWNILLRRALRSAFRGSKYRRRYSTWSRPNRKLPDDVPGYRTVRWEEPAIIVAVDVSGSVVSDEPTLRQFFSEIYHIAREVNTKVIVLPWDVEVKGEYVLEKPEDIFRIVKNIKMGGGTVVDPVLEYYLNKARELTRRGKPKPVFILLSDGWWINKNRDLFRQVRDSSTRAIYVYTAEEHAEELQGWTRIKLEIW